MAQTNLDFSDLALAKFLQAAPELGPMILNFSDLSSEMGDVDIAVGVFSLRVGDGLAFVPVVGRGDNIWPIDSIFVDNETQFRPLTKATISSLTNQAQMSPIKSQKIPAGVDKNPSVYNMINPPRTGKYTYASSSRLVEFLALMPNRLKLSTFEKISSERTIYDSLDKAFGLKTIFEVLKPTTDTLYGTSGEEAKPQSVVTGMELVGKAFTHAMANDIILQGYTVSQNPEFSRIAVSYQPYNQEGCYQEITGGADAGRDHMIVMNDGGSLEAHVPVSHRLNPFPSQVLGLLANGDYVKSECVIVSGDPVDREIVLKTIFNINPPKLIRDCNRGDTIVLFTTSGRYLGPFNVSSVVQNHMGAEVETYSADNMRKICAYKNHAQEASRIGDILFVPHNVIVLVLGQNRTGEVERNTNDAARKKELITSQFLGTEMDLRYDGVEFSAGRRVLGKEAQCMQYLVNEENIEPKLAKEFIKQAEVTKFVKIFLSKKASSSDFNPAEMPQHGILANDDAAMGPNGAFMPAIQEASRLGDGQVLEATIISQLLQVPDLFEYIEEYLPDIAESVDKLGRILFLTRVKLNQLSENLDPESVFALISQIKAVYRQLGDSVEKLKEISTVSKGFEPEEKVKQTNGS